MLFSNSSITNQYTELSRFISYILRHNPDSIALTLDSQGWALIDELVDKSGSNGTSFGRNDLLNLVAGSDKKRFSISDDGMRIRAAQGHSIRVDLGLEAQEPPPVLYHGTATRFLSSILAAGLKRQSRQHVHLSTDETSAHRVGQRQGKPVILGIDALIMHDRGFQFFLADNSVWLTNHVPPEYLSLIASNDTDSATTSTQPRLSK